jgi:CheY-like chemotaxis protein
VTDGYRPYILLVEDNPHDVALTERALEKNRIANELVVASDGERALALIHRAVAEDRLPAVVLLDLKLPKVDGIEVLRVLRGTASMRRIPVVVLTSSDEEKDLVKSYDLGVNSYVRKPVAFKHFVEVVGQLGCYWLILNQRPLQAAPPPPDARDT